MGDDRGVVPERVDSVRATGTKDPAEPAACEASVALAVKCSPVRGELDGRVESERPRVEPVGVETVHETEVRVSHSEADQLPPPRIRRPDWVGEARGPVHEEHRPATDPQVARIGERPPPASGCASDRRVRNKSDEPGLLHRARSTSESSSRSPSTGKRESQAGPNAGPRRRVSPAGADLRTSSGSSRRRLFRIRRPWRPAPPWFRPASGRRTRDQREFAAGSDHGRAVAPAPRSPSP